jgi:hypothetical protein
VVLAKSLKCKFQELAHTKIPTGDLNWPPHICNAKRICLKIVVATDMSMGGSEDGGDLDNERDSEFEGDNNKRDGEYKENDDDEGDMVGSNNNVFSFSAEKQEQLTVDNDDGGHLNVAPFWETGF